MAATTGTQWGISMTAGDVYTVAGNASGALRRLRRRRRRPPRRYLSYPVGMALDSAGDLYIADTNNNRIQEIAATTHTQWGISMTADDIYTVAGSSSGTSGHTGDGGRGHLGPLQRPDRRRPSTRPATSTSPTTGNNRIQEIAATTGTQWGISMTADDIYTVAGSSTGICGQLRRRRGGHLGAVRRPDGIALDSSGDLYIADYANNRVQEVPSSTGTQWGTVHDRRRHLHRGREPRRAPRATPATAGPPPRRCCDWPSGVTVDPAGDLYIADSSNNADPGGGRLDRRPVGPCR